MVKKNAGKNIHSRRKSLYRSLEPIPRIKYLIKRNKEWISNEDLIDDLLSREEDDSFQ